VLFFLLLLLLLLWSCVVVFVVVVLVVVVVVVSVVVAAAAAVLLSLNGTDISKEHREGNNGGVPHSLSQSPLSAAGGPAASMMADGGLAFSNTHILDTELGEEDEERRRLHHPASNHRCEY
jgi:hypothetical protein